MNRFLLQLRSLLVGSLTLVLAAQAPEEQIKVRTPAPSRDGVYASTASAPGLVRLPSRTGVDLSVAPPQPKRAAPQPEVQKRGGSYEMDLDDDSVSIEDGLNVDDPDAEVVVTRKPRTLGDEMMLDPAYQAKINRGKARAAAGSQDPYMAQIQEALKRQDASDKRIEALLKRQDATSDAVFGKRDATRTDAVVDAEFAEASASRRASTIARERGYSLVPALRTIRLRMLTASDSEQAGKAKAVVLEDVWDATFSSIAIPRGSLARLFIEGATGDTDTRIRLTVTEFQLPGGDAIQLRVPDAATDEIGATGPQASMDHRYGTRFMGAVGYAFVAALSAQGSKSPYGATATFDDVLRNNLSGQLGQQGAQSFQTGMAAKPIARLPEGKIVNMVLGTNLYLVPWQRIRPLVPIPNLLLPKSNEQQIPLQKVSGF